MGGGEEHSDRTRGEEEDEGGDGGGKGYEEALRFEGIMAFILTVSEDFLSREVVHINLFTSPLVFH